MSTNRKHRVLWWTAGIFGFFAVTAVAGVIVVATLDWNRAKPYIGKIVSSATGRKFSIDGNLAVKLGWLTTVSASQIKFENASWSKDPQMADIGQFDAQLNVRELLKFRMVLPLVTMSEVKLFLQKNAEGVANWTFTGPSPTDAVVPKRRTQVPVVEKLLVKNAAIVFDNQQTRAHMELKLNEAEAGGFWEAPVKLVATGFYQKLPMTLKFDGGSYQNLRNERELYPLQIDLGAGKLKVKIDGNLVEPLEMKGEDVTLDIQGDDMANLYPLIRLVFPSTPPYRLKGHLRHDGNVWKFSKFSGKVGGSDLSGDIEVDTGRERHLMKADLVSNTLDFKDLAGFIGGKPGKNPVSNEQEKTAAPKKDDDRIFPDQQYDLHKLRSMDADARLRAKRILAPNLPIDDLDARLTLTNGVLRFNPATFGVANGRLEIFSTFDASKETPKVNIDTRMRDLDLKRFLGQSSFAQKTLGPIGGRIVLTGTGASFRDLMATSSGNAFIAVGSGEISDLLVRLAGLNVARALGVVIRGDEPIPMRCGLLDLNGTDGQMKVQTLVFDTGTTVIYGEGNINLRDERVNIELLPVPKDFSPFSLRHYIRVNGPLKHISAFPDPLKTGTESIFKKIFNVVVMLALSPLQPRDLGTGKNVDCDALMAKVEARDTQKVVPKHADESVAAKNAPADQNREKRG